MVRSVLIPIDAALCAYTSRIVLRDPNCDRSLWLVMAQRQSKGIVWYLCHLPVEDERSGVEMALEDYGLRRRIEDYHRHLKDDYSLEKIILRRYSALKNFVFIFMMAMSFVYHHFESLSLEIVLEAQIKLVFRGRKLKEYLGFIYYKMAKALSWLFSKIKIQTLVTVHLKRVDNQLASPKK